MTTPELGEPGWYRMTKDGWQPITDDEAQAEIAAGTAIDLVHVNRVEKEEPQLW